MKWIIIILTLLLIPIAYGTVECNWLNEDGDFTNTTFVFQGDKEALQLGLEHDTLQTFRCKDQFTGWGTLEVSTLKVSKTLESEQMETLLFFFGLLIIVLLLLIAIWQEDVTLASIGSIMMIVMGVYIASRGWLQIRNMVSDMVGIAFVTVGLYILLKVNMENM